MSLVQQKEKENMAGRCLREVLDLERRVLMGASQETTLILYKKRACSVICRSS